MSAQWVRITRQHGPDLYVGPYPDAETGHRAMQDALLIDGLVEDDCLDCDLVPAAPGVPGDDDEQYIVDLDDPDHIGRPTVPPAPQPGPREIVEIRIRCTVPRGLDHEVIRAHFDRMVAEIAPFPAGRVTSTDTRDVVGDWWFTDEPVPFYPTTPTTRGA